MGFEYWVHLVDALDLDDDGIFDEEIEAVFSEGTAFVNGGNGHLSLEPKALFVELNRKRLFVERLEKPWTELSMDGDGAADNSLGQRISLGVHWEDLEAPPAIKGKTKGLPERCRVPVSGRFRPFNINHLLPQDGAMTTFESMHQDEIVGKLTTVDRMIFNGYLMSFFWPGYFLRFLCRQDVLLKDFGSYVQKATDAIKGNARRMAEDAGRPYRYFPNTVRRKDELAKRIAEEDGITKGLICVFATMELRGSFEVKPNHKTHRLEVVRAARKCTHFYFYFIDPEFGFMHVRIQSWFPFEIQVYINGREWLARQLDQHGVAYRRYENALLRVDDLKLAERLCKRLRHRKWPRFLNALARRVNPWLPVVKKFTGRGYYWVIDECEVATDLMWKNRSSLQKILPGLFDHAVASFSANDVMRFLGRRLTGNFQGELVSDHQQRPEGRRVKHRIKNNWLKMYDKYSVLRVETTINNPGEFRVLRVAPDKKGRNKLRWMRMGKGVANFWRYLEIGESANHRYLEALASAPVQGEAVAQLDGLCRSRIVDGKCYPKLNPVSESDCTLFRAVLAGEHAINGFRNHDLQVHLYRKPPQTPQEAKRRCARTSRLIRKLRGHRLLAKVPRSRLYRVTARGYRILSAALQYRSVGFPNQLDPAA